MQQDIPRHPTPASQSYGAMRILLLGPFECWRGDEPIRRDAWRTRPTLTLLKLLIDERDRPVPVERLIDIIWPTSDPGAARQSLQVAIRTLRLALEPDLRRGSDSRYIKTEPGTYRFDSTGCVIDVDQFQSAAQRALRVSGLGTLTEAIAACEEAVAHYRGDFLSDDPYSEWAFSTRERLRSRFLDVLDALGSALRSAGQWERAIDIFERALDLDPYREELYRQLMRCHMAQSRRSHALTVFERCRSVLQQELSVDPAPETLALYEEVIDGRLSTTAVHGDRRLDSGALAGDLKLPFVGRVAELASLARALDRSTAEEGVLASVSGGPGAGKTRLVQEFVNRVVQYGEGGSSRERRALWIDCHEAEQSVPFAPLSRMIATLLERLSSTGDRRRLAPYARSLARLAPQASDLADDGDQSPAPIETSQLYEAITQAVRMVFRRDGGVLVIDDMQWADAGTLQWISYALARLGTGVLVTATIRPAERSHPELEQLLDDARRAGRRVDLPLAGLSVGDLDNLIAGGLRDPDHRIQVSQRLLRMTRGQPLFVVEMLRDLVADGRIVVDEQSWWRIEGAGELEFQLEAMPGRELREIVRARVERLAPTEHEVFRTICVIAAECRAPLIAEATGVSVASALASLDALLAEDLVRISVGGRGYVVEHPLVREVVYEELGPARREERHLAVARALRQLGASYPSSPGQTLHHLVAGGAPVPEIIEYSELAGDRSLRQSALTDAINSYEVAIRHLEDFDPGIDDGAQLVRLAEKRADALAAAGRWDDAITEYERLQHLGGVLSQSRTMRKLGGVLGDVRGEYERSLGFLDAAQRQLTVGRDEAEPDEVEIELGRIEAARTSVYFFTSDYARTVEHGERALSAWTGRLGVERDEIEVHSRIGNALQRLGRLDEAERRYYVAIARASILGEPALEARLRDSLGGLLFVRGRIRQALDIHTETAQTGATLGIPRLELAGLANTGNALTFLGELDEARSIYYRAVERAEELDAQYTVMHALVGLGETLIRMGELEEARAVLGRGIALSEEIHSPQRRAHAYLHLAEIALLADDPNQALDWVLKGLELGQQLGDMHSRREGLPLLAHIRVRLDQPEKAEAAASEGLEIAVSGGFRVSQARNRLALAEAQIEMNAAGVLEQLELAEEIFRDTAVPYELAQALILRSSISIGEDRSALLKEARQLAAACPAPLLLNLIDELAAPG